MIRHDFWCVTCGLSTHDPVKASTHQYTHPDMRKIGRMPEPITEEK